MLNELWEKSPSLNHKLFLIGIGKYGDRSRPPVHLAKGCSELTLICVQVVGF